jgi:pyrroline-5-carboxylate reductase
LRIALIGHGKMGAALLTQWRKAKAHDFWVIDPACTGGSGDPVSGNDRVRFLAAPPAIANCRFDLIIVALKPQIIETVLPAYVDRLAAGGFVVSIAAGCSIARLQAIIGDVPVIRIMPNLPAAIGAGVSGLCADASASAAQRAAIETLMQAAGTTLWVDDEDRLDRLTAVAGSGPGYVFEMARCYVEAAETLGFSTEQARDLVLGTIAGSIAMAQATPLSLAELRASVTSKNGTTAAGLAALNGDGGLASHINGAVDAAYRRAVELR